MSKIPKYIKEEMKEINKKREGIEVICMDCGYTWNNEEGNICIMCSSNINVEL